MGLLRPIRQELHLTICCTHTLNFCAVKEEGVERLLPCLSVGLNCGDPISLWHRVDTMIVNENEFKSKLYDQIMRSLPVGVK
jgi:hypothetical protein